jgi:hypothetical protein
MDFPQNTPDLDAGREHLHEFYAKLESYILNQVDVLAKSGFSDKRWCSVARTHFEEGFMALHRGLRDFPGDDPQEYGKVATHQPMPRGFTPDVEPAFGPGPNLQIKDHKADGEN